MPKRGQTQPWKVYFYYPEYPDRSGTIPKHALAEAAREMVTLRKRGATVTVSLKDAAGLHAWTDEQIVEYLRAWGQSYDRLISDIEKKVWEQTDEVEG
jgi:hypothetical protein